MRVLVTGATGYIGGRLVPRLLELGHSVRALVRDSGRAARRSWAGEVELVRGDLLEPASLAGLFEGIDVAYYLVHSMYAGADFAEYDRRAAGHFAEEAGGVAHVIYMGGLLPEKLEEGKPRGSLHLRSRAEIGRILARSLPTTELRAGPIIGSGSASFEMLRYLTERLPVMLAPDWICNRVQPIGVGDVLSYLTAALERGPSGVVEIGAERLSYRDMMLEYARQRGLRRWIVPLPALIPPRLGAGWIGLVTPIPGSLAKPLVEGMTQPLLAHGYRAAKFFPQIQPMSYADALGRALRRIKEHAVETRWSDAVIGPGGYEYRNQEGLVREVRTRFVPLAPERVFRVIEGLGGEHGWLTWNWAWGARGLIDQLLGGPGLARGRRDPDLLQPGEVLDFWRVETLEPARLLRLRAEARLPGRAWLEWRTEPEGQGTRLTQTAAFAPRGLRGAVYWSGLYPLHRLIFTDLIRAIAERALERERAECPEPVRH